MGIVVTVGCVGDWGVVGVVVFVCWNGCNSWRGGRELVLVMLVLGLLSALHESQSEVQK